MYSLGRTRPYVLVVHLARGQRNVGQRTTKESTIKSTKRLIFRFSATGWFFATENVAHAERRSRRAVPYVSLILLI